MNYQIRNKWLIIAVILIATVAGAARILCLS